MTDLGQGVWQLQSRVLSTNSVLGSDAGGSVVCDPSIFADEVAEIRDRAGSPDATQVLITHSDWDHTCGIPRFAGATVAAGAATAQAIADGTAAEKLREDGRVWEMADPGPMRVDHVLKAGEETDVGPERVLVIDAPGHQRDGSAYLPADRGLLITGDYLSQAIYPVLWASLAEAIESYGRLLAAVRDGQAQLVVPGHGPRHVAGGADPDRRGGRGLPAGVARRSMARAPMRGQYRRGRDRYLRGGSAATGSHRT